MAKPLEIVQAGQASVQKATDPHSKAGKQRSSQNAIKHGIFSEAVVLPGEPRDRYELLLKELQEALQPEGRLEELLVEKLASIGWRYRRLLAAEGAEIRQASEFLEWDRKNRERWPANTATVDFEHLFDGDSGLISKIQNPDVLDRCIELLCEVRQQIESSGFNKERDTAALEQIYGPETDVGKTLLQTYLTWVDTAEAPEEERQREGNATPNDCKTNVLSAVDKELRSLRKYGREHRLNESKRTKLEVLRHSVPEPVRLDSLLRCEASLERSFDRTLSQLERMQRLRRGQPVAPRVDVNVSG
jgi:hypothetical protein